MATRFVLYVDNVLGVATNSGSSAIAAPRISGVAATWGAGATVIQLDTPIDLSVVTANLDTINLSGAGNTNTRKIYHILSVDNVNDQVTVAETLTAASAANTAWAIGGALPTNTQAWGTAGDGVNAISGTLYDHVYVKGGTDYTLADLGGAGGTLWTFALVGGRDQRTFIEGYTSTPGDGGFCVLSGTGQTGTNTTVLLVTSRDTVTRNVKCTGSLGTGSLIKHATISGQVFEHCWVTDAVALATGPLFVASSSSGVYIGCRSNNTTTATGSCYALLGFAFGCIAQGAVGVGSGYNPGAGSSLRFCIADTCGSSGVYASGGYVGGVGNVTFFCCTFYNNWHDGVHISDSAASLNPAFIGNIFDKNGVRCGTGYGINRAGVTAGFAPAYDGYNNFNANQTGARNNVADTTGNDVTPKDFIGSCLTAPATQDFSVNTTAKAKGFPGAFQVGGTGYLDVGAVQRQEAGGMIMSRVRTGF